MNKVVVHFHDGGILKGFTNDFLPAKDIFHLSDASGPPEARPWEIRVAELKALFFVKDFAGAGERHRGNEFTRPTPGRKIKVVFKDGEVLVGTTQGYQPGRPGFFVVPADPTSNNDRCFVVSASAQEVSFL
jgi:hypothetical protein